MRKVGETLTPARYCPKCGAKTVLVEGEREFDPITGRPTRLVNVRCPNRRWWNFGHYVFALIGGGLVFVKWADANAPELTWWTQGEGSK